MENSNEKPTAFKLKELKAPLQKEAMRIDRSLHWLVLKVLRDFVRSLKNN